MAYEDDNSVTLDNISTTPKIPWIAKFLANQGLAPQMEGPPAPPQAQDVQPQPDFSIGAPQMPPPAPPNPMQDITQSMTQGAPQMAPETKTHKLLRVLLGAAVGAGEGAGQRTFGGGFQTAENASIQRAFLPWEYAQKQAQLANIQADTRQKNLAGQMATITGPYGPMTVPISQISHIYGPMIGAQGRVSAAQIGAKAKLDAIGLQTQIQQGKVSRLVPTIDPDTNQPAYEAFNPFNQSMGIIKGSLVPGLMAKTSDTIQYETDADGNLHAMPKRTVTRPQLPGAQPAAPQGQSTPTYPATGAPTGDQPKVNAPRPNAPQPNALPRPNAPTPSARPQGGGTIIPGFKGKAAADMGVAYDPQTNTRLWTTRQEAGDKGYQDFAPGGRNAARAMENDRQLNVRLGDVEQKISEYNSTFSKDLSENDSYYINRALADMEKAATDYGLTGHVGLAPALNIVMQGQKADDINQLSPEGKKRLFAYVNAREAMNGYSRVLSGSGQTNETSLQLNLDVLPKPNVNGGTAKEAFSQFRQNLDTVGQGIPRLKSVKASSEYRQVYEFPKSAPQQQQKESYPFQRLMGR